MTEENKPKDKEEVKEEKAEEKPNETDERIKKINEAADRLEAAERRLAERESSLKEAEALNRLGGTTEQPQPEKPKEETASEYMKRVMSGGLNAKPAETGEE